jgi:hypothetical protein
MRLQDGQPNDSPAAGAMGRSCRIATRRRILEQDASSSRPENSYCATCGIMKTMDRFRPDVPVTLESDLVDARRHFSRHPIVARRPTSSGVS